LPSGIGQGLQGTVVRAAQNPARDAVIEEGVDASCNMRFSLRTITSGACSSISFFKTIVAG
jgi:hypothetical protein